jgi:hypothetical protein
MRSRVWQARSQRLVLVFVFAYSILARLEYAFVPDLHLVLANPWPHIVLDGSDCIDFGIALLDDCLDVSPSLYSALRACRLTPASPITTLTTTHPRTATSTKVAAPTTLGFLDIGTRAITSHEHSSASSTVQASVTQLRPRHSRSDCRGCQPVGFYTFGFSPV